MTTLTIELRREGALSLPDELRSKYGLQEGDLFTLIDLGDGSFLLAPLISKVDRVGNLIAQAMSEQGIAEDEMLKALDEERAHFYQERYAQG